MLADKSNSQLIVILGATASGKTSFAIALAQKFNTEIISVDARQVYSELKIGTAKPTEKELMQVKHHFVNSLSIHQNYSAGQFEKEALKQLNTLFQKHHSVVMVGGSGLYIKAVCEGLDNFPPTDEDFRNNLKKRYHETGLDGLLEELKVKDTTYYTQVDKRNPQRIMRALEVIEQSGRPFSTFLTIQKKARPFSIVKLGINWSRADLYKRINQRVENMIADGLVEEARNLYPHRQLNALQTVGYNELFAHFEGTHDLQEAIRLIKRNTRRYAKRQLTWFKADKTIRWIEPNSSVENIFEMIQ